MSEFTANATEPTTDPSDSTTPPQWPKALLYTSREEFYGQDADHQPLELIVKEGMTENTCLLPEDLQGHVFIVGPVGSEDSPRYEGSSVVEPAQDGWTPLFNGDGMIYRLDFHQTPQTDSDADRTEVGKAWMASRIANTPDYYADLGLETNPRYKKEWPTQYPFLKFNNFGLSRLSLEIGARNSLNTALLPMKFSDSSERLLVTWDAGRPYEVDPRTLDPIAPIGWAEQWKPMTQTLDQLKMPFPTALSTAHPVFDTHTDEMFTVNGGKSLRNLMCHWRFFPSGAIEFANRYLKNKNSFLRKIFDFCIHKWVQFIKFWVAFFDWLFEDILRIPDINGENFVYLNHWTGSGTDITQWEVVDENNRPLKIRQSLHQMALTRDYVILSDSAFKLSLANLLPYFDIKQSDEIQKKFLKATKTPEEIDRILKQRRAILLEFLREHLSYPALDYTDIYIIPRKNLQPEASSVTAKKVTIAPETAHFLADYENPDGKISLYVAHSCASDPAEFIHQVDESYYPEPKITQALQERSGATVAPMDVNKLGCWQIDVETGTTEHSLLPVEEAKEYLWSLAIYAWRGFQPDRFTDIYWNCWGAWQDLVSTFIVDMYDDYARRTVSMSEMLDEILKNCQPSNLLRMHIDRTSPSPKLGVPDAYEFPPGYFGNSPQFIPRLGSEDQTNGYISCIVIHSDRPLSDKCELWIFDARDLSSGPRYRLSHPQLNIGITVHSTWLSKLETPPVRTDYSVREDYADLVAATNSEAIETLFQDDVYPHFE